MGSGLSSIRNAIAQASAANISLPEGLLMMTRASRFPDDRISAMSNTNSRAFKANFLEKQAQIIEATARRSKLSHKEDDLSGRTFVSKP